jgi:hypothetical protein
LHEDSLTCTEWTVKKYQIPRAAEFGNVFTEGSHLIDIFDAMCADLTCAHNGPIFS